ncbi:MAG: hypothetical protein K6F07_02525 [Bacilli bacterium]|nr:hypothetical protein [Bacilli bacterium]
MSEIKGQLLGIILVLTVFGVVGGALATIFYSMSQAVETKVTNEVDEYSHTDIPEETSTSGLAHFDYLSY